MPSFTEENYGSRSQDFESPFPTTTMNFVGEESEASEGQALYSNLAQRESPFRSVYELENEAGSIDPEAEEAMEFLNQLYDEEFDEAVFELVSEANELYQDRFESEFGDPLAQKMQAARMIEQHFAPLVSEAEMFLDTMANEFGQRSPSSLDESEIESFIDRYEPQTSLAPSFENFFGGLKNKLKGAFNKAASLAKQGISLAGNFALKPILEKISQMVMPLMQRVVKQGISKLPAELRPVADQFAKRLLNQEYEEEATAEEDATPDVSGIQREFDGQIANLLFSREAVEQELAIAEYVRGSQQPITHDPLSDLDRARAQFVMQLGELREGEDPTPLVQNFIPAILPALKLGISMAGRAKVVSYLARLLAKLIRKLIGPEYAPALSQAMVDVGLRLIHLEATPENEVHAARSAVAATVEETVRQIVALPEYILDNQELLEGYAVEAFEQSAAVNLPPVLPERVYEARPELREMTGLKGTWVMQPLQGAKRYKKCTRVYETTITPHMARVVKTFCDVPLAEFLQDRLGLSPGREIKARVHLYEAIPGTLLSQICKSERNVPGLGTITAWTQLHPLTPEAAGMVFGQPGLGREVPEKYLDHQPTTAVGQRLYYLEIPEARPQVVPVAGGAPKPRRIRQLHIRLDFPHDQIKVNLFLSEAVAQAIAVKLRQKASIGTVMPHLSAVYEPRVKKILTGKHHSHLKTIHGKVPPKGSRGRALSRLPQAVRELLGKNLIEWLGKNLTTYLQQKSADFIAATENPADGVTLKIAFTNPPGFAHLRKIWRGESVNIQEMQAKGGVPDANIQVIPGFSRA
jgi:hypothetical protein